MSVSPDRVLCPRCGANNFATQAACWKCGASLSGSAPARVPVPGGAPAAMVAATPPPRPASPSSPALSADPSIANMAAVALAFFFSFIAVPVGLVFMMLDDRRKVEIGKITLIWGLIFSFFQFFVSWWLFHEMMGQIGGLLPSLPGRSQPTPDTKVPEPQFPGADQ